MALKIDLNSLLLSHQTLKKKIKFMKKIFEIYVQGSSVSLGYLQRKERIPLLSVTRPHKHLLQRRLNTKGEIQTGCIEAQFN